MKVRLLIQDGDKTEKKKLIGISEIEIRKGHLEFWTRDDEGRSKIELSIRTDKVIEMVVFKHIVEKNFRKVKERKSRVKGTLFRAPVKRR